MSKEPLEFVINEYLTQEELRKSCEAFNRKVEQIEEWTPVDTYPCGEMSPRSQKMWEMFEKCIGIMEKKGADYRTHKKSQNGCFKLIAELSGASEYLVWTCFFMKHVVSILNYCKGQGLASEPIEERIADAINYLGILHTMILEDKEESKC